MKFGNYFLVKKPFVLVFICALFFSSCAVEKPLPLLEELDKSAEDYVNPYPEGTYLHFQGRRDYPETYDSFKNPELLAQASGHNVNIVIDISKQRGQLFVNRQVALDYPLSTGISSFPTPTGEFRVLEKVASGKESNKYGKIYDAEGKVINGNADITVHEVPEGGRFDGSDMPYWMRLSRDGIGMHVGKVRRKPVSHGCLRHQRSIAKIIFSKVRIGTPVSIQR